MKSTRMSCFCPCSQRFLTYSSRELSDYELFGRDLTEAEATLFARDYDELFTRHPDDLDAREYEDIHRRKSIAAKIRSGFKKAFGFVKNMFFKREAGQDAVFAREYDEIDARDLDAIYQRYIEELEARAPGLFQHIFQGGMYVAYLPPSYPTNLP